MHLGNAEAVKFWSGLVKNNATLWVGIGTAVFVVLVWVGLDQLGRSLPDKAVADGRPSSAPAAAIDGKCVSSAGNIWSGVNVYSDSRCSNLAGFIMSAKDGAQTIKVSIDSGGEAWYSLDDVKRLYVKSDDAAIARKGLVMEN